MANLLGIDYGRSYIGVALATTPLAEPLMILDNDEKVLAHIKQAISLNQIDTIVVGISEAAMAQETREFAEKLTPAISTPIVFHDETLTSHEASLKIMHAKRSTRSDRQDAFQATVMLQDYLDTHPSGQPVQS